MLATAPLVVDKNIESQNKPSRSRQEKEDHRQPGIAKDSKRRLNSHQHRSADNKSSYYETERNAVGDLL